MKGLVSEFAESDEISRFSANKVITIQVDGVATQVPKKWWNFPKNQIWARWRESHPTLQISQSAFNKLLRKECPHIKVCRRKTDMCTTCQEGQRVNGKLNKLKEKLAALHSHCPPRHASKCQENKCRQVTPEQRDKLSEWQTIVEDFQYHFQHKEHQQQQFEICKQQVDAGHGLLIIDFKENLHLNMASEETSHNYYNRPQRAYFSLTLYYRTQQGQLNTKFFDCISTTLSKDSWWVTHALTHIFQSNAWKDMHINTATLWMDNGPHFRSHELFRFFFDCPSKFKLKINWNFFTENHGKSICDSHFSKVSNALKTYSLQQQMVVDGTEAAMRAITSMFTFWQQEAEEYNRHKRDTTKPKDLSYFDLELFTIHIPEHATKRKVLNFTHLKVYSHYERQSKKLLASVMSNSPTLIEIPYTSTTFKIQRNKQKTGYPTPQKDITPHINKQLHNRALKRKALMEPESEQERVKKRSRKLSEQEKTVQTQAEHVFNTQDNYIQECRQQKAKHSALVIKRRTLTHTAVLDRGEGKNCPSEQQSSVQQVAHTSGKKRKRHTQVTKNSLH